MPSPLTPTVIPLSLPPIFSPAPGQDVAIDVDKANNSARVVFYFARNQTVLRPGHREGINVLASILGGRDAQAEFYGSADSTGTDRVNNRVVGARLGSVVFGLFDVNISFQTKWQAWNFGEKFGKDPIAVSQFPGAGPDADNTDDDTMRVVVVYAWPDLARRFSMWMDEPHRVYGLLHPELLTIMLPVQVL
jgi:hypothetical protein